MCWWFSCFHRSCDGMVPCRSGFREIRGHLQTLRKLQVRARSGHRSRGVHLGHGYRLCHSSFLGMEQVKEILLVKYLETHTHNFKDWFYLHLNLQIHSWGSRHLLRTWLVHKKRGVQFRELHLLPHDHLLHHANYHHHLLLLTAPGSTACCECPNSLLWFCRQK